MTKKSKNIFLTVFAAIGFLIFSPMAQAAVTQATAATEMLTSGQKIKAGSSYTPLFGFSLTQNAGETLSSVALTLTGTVTPTTDIAGLRIYADTSKTGANDDVIDGGDTICGTNASVNINTATTINTGTCAIPTAKTGNYDFIGAVATDANISDGETITFSVGAGTGVYGLSSGSVLATPTATAANTLTVAPAITTVSAYTDRLIVTFDKNIDGGSAGNCSNYVVNGSALSCSGYGSPWPEFSGNKVTIKNLTLSGTASLSIPANNNIRGTNGSNITLIAYSNPSIPVSALTLPSITSISPTSGAVGDTIVIAGANFGASQGGSKVYFSGGYSNQTGPLPPVAAATYSAWSDTSISVVVPSGANGGPVNVMVGGVMSDMNQSSMFDITANYTAKVYYSADNSTPMPDGDNGNIRFAMWNMGGIIVFKVGDGRMTYNSGTDTFTITSMPSMGNIWAYDITGAHLSSNGQQVNTSSTQTMRLLATTRKISGTIALGATCAAAGQNKNVMVMAMPEAVDMGGSGFQPMQPIPVTTGPANGQTACQSTYNIAVPTNGGYRVEAHLPMDSGTTTFASSNFTDPSGQFVNITNASPTASGINFVFTAATHKIVGQVTRPSGSLTTTEKGMLWVYAYQPQGGKGTGASVGSDGTFTLNVSKGPWHVGVSGPNMPYEVGKDINVDDTYLISSYTAGTAVFTIAPPTDFIEGYVKDSAGNGLSNVSLYGWRSGGPGGGNARTDSQGYYKMFVSAGTGYTIGAHSQDYGFLGEQSSITVSSAVHPTVNFTVSSTDNYNISGTITKNGQALQQAYVFITSGENGQMMGGGGTSSSGTYSARVRGGTGYWIHVGVPGQGEIYKASIGTVAADNSSQNIAITTSQIKVRVSPASGVDSAFVGVDNGMGGQGKGFSSASVVTSDCTGSGSSCKEYQIDVARPASGSTTYYVNGYVPGFGSLSQASVVVSSSGGFTETNGTANDGIVEYSLSVYTVSGTVSGDDVSSTWMAAFGSNGSNGVQVNSDGTYSLKLRNGAYDLTANKPKYMAAKKSITVNGADLTGQNFTLTAASNTITGAVYLPDGTTTVTNAKVWATNGTGGFAVASTDASGAYTLNVGTGSWTVDAAYDGYSASSTTVSPSISGVNFTLAADSNFTNSMTTGSVTPSSGGVVQASGAKIDFPSNALGTDTSAGVVQIKNTSNVPSMSGATIVGTPKEITATNSSNQNVTTLSGSATITITATRAELAAAGMTTVEQVNKVELKYFDSTANAWVTLPTTVTLSVPTATLVSELDSDPAATFTATVSHLSDFALGSPTGLVVLDTPSNFAATPGNARVDLSWSSVSGATKYYIYRLSGGLYPYLGQTTSLAYADTGLANGNSYSYKVSALNDSGSESAASSVASASPSGGSGGSSSSWSASASSASSSSTSSSSTSSTTPVATSTTQVPAQTATSTPSASSKPVNQMNIEEIKAEIARLLELVSQLKNQSSQAAAGTPSGAVGIPDSHKFTKVLNLGQISDDVRYLQIFLNSDSDTKVADAGPGSPGKETNKFGSLTKRAVIKFQEKYSKDILTPIGYSKGTGKVGAMTIGKINELLGR